MRLTEKEWLGLSHALDILYSDYDQSDDPKMWAKQKKEIVRLQEKLNKLYFSKENKGRKNENNK